VKTHVSNKRLLKLAAFLRTLPRKRFNYKHWVGNDWKGEPDLMSCGTAACALGWATTIPLFRKEGLRLRAYSNGGGAPMLLDKEGEETSHYDAGARVFGITNEESHYLFSDNSGIGWDATPKQVAKKIENFVAKRVRS
jgi:hypothetical protein